MGTLKDYRTGFRDWINRPVKWLCTDCSISFAAEHLRDGSRCPYCGGARTIKDPDQHREPNRQLKD